MAGGEMMPMGNGGQMGQGMGVGGMGAGGEAAMPAPPQPAEPAQPAEVEGGEFEGGAAGGGANAGSKMMIMVGGANGGGTPVSSGGAGAGDMMVMTPGMGSGMGGNMGMNGMGGIPMSPINMGMMMAAASMMNGMNSGMKGSMMAGPNMMMPPMMMGGPQIMIPSPKMVPMQMMPAMNNMPNAMGSMMTPGMNVADDKAFIMSAFAVLSAITSAMFGSLLIMFIIIATISGMLTLDASCAILFEPGEAIILFLFGIMAFAETITGLALFLLASRMVGSLIKRFWF
uniref:Uncharacterized protein n=1 Tax=Magallana gigas TaxID=29159 RepID=K1QVH9_MAGGI